MNESNYIADTEGQIAANESEGVPVRKAYAKTYARKKKPDLAALMKAAGIRWGTHEGRRILNIPSKATPEQVKAVYDALKE